jgi:S-adenosyl methyltransferase
MPSAVTAAYQNRRFLERAVQFLAACAGIRQFIDVGCGLLAPGAVHDVALGIAPDARVAYVDHDPAVIAQLDTSLAGHPAVRAILGDVRRPGSILGHPALVSFIDTAEPVAVIMTAVLQYVADEDDPGGIVGAFMSAVPRGSQLALSHAGGDGVPEAAAECARSIFETAESPFVPRRHAQVAGFFAGLELVAPGVISGAAWRPGYQAADPRRTTFFAGLGLKS